MKKSLCLLLVMSLAFAGSCAKQPKGKIGVSSVQLLSDPKKYEGYVVITRGHLRESMSGFLHLYLTHEDALTQNKFAAVWIDDVPETRSLINAACGSSYVEITGLFGIIPSLELHGIKQVEKVYRFKNLESEPITSEPCWPQ